MSSVCDEIYAGLTEGGVTFAGYLPDSRLYEAELLLEADPTVRTVVCAREDEGIAIAVGAALAGALPAALMEGSGVGYAGLILTRAKLQRTPLLLIFSRTRALAEPFDYHAAAREVGEGVLSGLGIPYVILDDVRTVRDKVMAALATVRGQKAVVGIGVPGRLVGEGRPNAAH